MRIKAYIDCIVHYVSLTSSAANHTIYWAINNRLILPKSTLSATTPASRVVVFRKTLPT